VQTAEVRLEKAKLDRERATVVAPFDGVVDRVSVAKGERVSSGQEVTKVVNLSDLRIEASVLEHDLPLIKVGGQALVSTAADPTRQAIGRVVAVLPLVDSTTRAGTRLRPRAGQFRPASGHVRRRPARGEPPNEARGSCRPARSSSATGAPRVRGQERPRAVDVHHPGRSNGVDTEVLPDSATGQIPSHRAMR
jgi:pyruvate/2-oxoglutarate dehydrogenase complex dihydrolipoamide acyltransferase (E2) component